MKIDKNIIKELSDYLEEFNLTEIEITEKDTKIKVSKNNTSINNLPKTASPTINTQSGDTMSKN
ncbi:acetyl-CoA carboxylase biotin carboxyl carrier protein subunit, partial [bacterium]|nr:acetyl-CoA carboxylase biotin carboxyl carrier protein subunit [bacterium]